MTFSSVFRFAHVLSYGAGQSISSPTFYSVQDWVRATGSTPQKSHWVPFALNRENHTLEMRMLCGMVSWRWRGILLFCLFFLITIHLLSAVSLTFSFSSTCSPISWTLLFVQYAILTPSMFSYCEWFTVLLSFLFLNEKKLPVAFDSLSIAVL